MNKFTLYLLIFATVLALVGCEYSSKWDSSMPDDGSLLCSMKGEALTVQNNTWGFVVTRQKLLDGECAKRLH